MTENKLKAKSRRKSRQKEDFDYDSDESIEEHHHYYMDDTRKRRHPRKRDHVGPPEVHHHYYYEPPKKKGRSSKPGIVGVLLLIVGILGLISASAMFFGGWFVGNLGGGFEFFGMEDNADISGRVTFVNGTPVENVTISIEGEPLITYTDADGYYILYNVPTGNRKIKVEKEGYDTIRYKTFITPSGERHDDRHDEDKDKENEYDFTLRPGNSVVEQGSYPPFEFFQNMIYVCAILVIVFSIIALIGAVFAFQRTHFVFVLVATIVGIFTFGFFIGALLSLIAVFILILSRNEFNKHENNYQENM